MKQAQRTRGSYVEPGQSFQEYCKFLKKKSILEFNLFKKKYERISKHISGMPSSESQLNPFTRQYKPSVFSENTADPKMGIPQNESLFMVINAKFEDKDKDKKKVKKYETEEE